MPPSVDDLRRLFRSLFLFRAVYEADGVDTITGPDGEEWSLWDLEYLLAEARAHLPQRQVQAIEWFLVLNMREVDVASRMGVSATNPVGMYATAGLEQLVEWIGQGRLPRFRDEGGPDGTHEVWSP